VHLPLIVMNSAALSNCYHFSALVVNRFEKDLAFLGYRLVTIHSTFLYQSSNFDKNHGKVVILVETVAFQ
jgi:nitrate reductase NapAB chaperone NapD